MSRYVSEYDVGLNPIVNESQLDKAIATIDAKLRKVRSGAHEALATQLQSLLRTTMRVARLPSPTKAMEYISNATQGGYTFAQRRVITSGVGKAMTEIRGATQAEAAANRAAAQEQSRAVKMQKQREREQSRLDRWFQTSRGSSPIQEVQNMVLSQIENNTAAENMAKAKSAAIFAKKQEQFDIGRRALLREGLTLRSQGGTEKQLETWQNKVAKFADSWQTWAKQDKKNANSLNTLVSRALNPKQSDLANIGKESAAGFSLAKLKGMLGKFGSLGMAIYAVKKIWDFTKTQALVGREMAMNSQYSKVDEIRARNLYGMTTEEYNAHTRDTQTFAMRAMMGEVSDDEWLTFSMLRDGGRAYRAALSGNQAELNRALESAFANMPQDQARYLAGKLGYEKLLSASTLTRETRNQVEKGAISQGLEQERIAAAAVNAQVITDAQVHKGQGWLLRQNRVMEENTRAAFEQYQANKGRSMKEIVQDISSGKQSLVMNNTINNNFDSDDPTAAKKISEQILQELNGFTRGDLQQIQQYNAGRAR